VRVLRLPRTVCFPAQVCRRYVSATVEWTAVEARPEDLVVDTPSVDGSDREVEAVGRDQTTHSHVRCVAAYSNSNYVARMRAALCRITGVSQGLTLCAILRLATSLLGRAQSTSTSSLCASSQER
jgi:hypothetical protein